MRFPSNGLPLRVGRSMKDVNVKAKLSWERECCSLLLGSKASQERSHVVLKLTLLEWLREFKENWVPFCFVGLCFGFFVCLCSRKLSEDEIRANFLFLFCFVIVSVTSSLRCNWWTLHFRKLGSGWYKSEFQSLEFA